MSGHTSSPERVANVRGSPQGSRGAHFNGGGNGGGDCQAFAGELKNSGVRIISVAIGSGAKGLQNLGGIASSQEDLLQVTGSAGYASILKDITEKLCSVLAWRAGPEHVVAIGKVYLHSRVAG